jgi:anti-sigma factor RsiW
MNPKMRELLVMSFDTELSASRRQQLDAALASSEELRAERDALVAMRASAAATAAAGFGPYFAERVMAQVSAAGEPERSMLFDLFTVFKPVALAGLVALAVLVPLGGRALYESVSGQEQTLTDMAQSAYALEMEEVLCQTD